MLTSLLLRNTFGAQVLGCTGQVISCWLQQVQQLISCWVQEVKSGGIRHVSPVAAFVKFNVLPAHRPYAYTSMLTHTIMLPHAITLAIYTIILPPHLPYPSSPPPFLLVYQPSTCCLHICHCCLGIRLLLYEACAYYCMRPSVVACTGGILASAYAY